MIKETVGTIGWCTDKLGRDCFKYTDDQCVGKYAPWAREHCALRCGYCPRMYFSYATNSDSVTDNAFSTFL